MKPYRSATYFDYQMRGEWSSLSRGELASILSRHAAFAPSEISRFSSGFAVFEGDGTWIQESESGVLFQIKTYNKRVSASFIKEELQRELKKRPAMSSTGRRKLRDDIERSLLPRAIPVVKYVQVYLSYNGFMVVDSLNSRLLSSVLHLIPCAIEGFSSEPSFARHVDSPILSRILTDETLIPEGVSLGRQVSLVLRTGESQLMPLLQARDLLNETGCRVNFVEMAGALFDYRLHFDGAISHIKLHRGVKFSLEFLEGAYCQVEIINNIARDTRC